MYAHDPNFGAMFYICAWYVLTDILYIRMEQTLAYISQFGYFALFPLAVLEGPIVTLIGGFLVRLGILNPLIVYAIVVLGDIIGDALYYVIGRFGRHTFLNWIGRHIGVTHEKLESVRTHFASHGYKTITAAKLIQGLGPVGLIAAGGAHVPYLRYMLMCLSVSLVQSALFLAIGFLFGHAYALLNHYLGIFTSLSCIGAVLLITTLLLKRLRKSKQII